MPKPRIIISSTCYDLSDARSALTAFLVERGFDVENSQLPNFGVDPKLHSHTACIEAVKQCDYLILIIGGRYGGTYIGSTKSITNEEYRKAVKMGIPTLIFVDERVENSIRLFKKNPTADFSSIVDNTKIFDFVENIRAGATNNWIFTYKNVSEIIETLKAQIAHYLLLFSQMQISGTKSEKTDSGTKLPYVKFPPNLQAITQKGLGQDEETGLLNGLKDLNNILSKILLSDTKEDLKREKLKTLWVIALYGKLGYDGASFICDNSIFKEYTWSTSRGTRVFKQFDPYGVKAYYDQDDDDGSIEIRLSFKNENEDINTAYALSEYVKDLIAKYGDDEGFDFFIKADMRLYTEIEDTQKRIPIINKGKKSNATKDRKKK